MTEKARGGDVLFIDGNRDGFGVPFDHKLHADSLASEHACGECHHMNMPQDKESGCWECHSAMYTETDIVNHDWHASPDGANIACNDCHTPDLNRTEYPLPHQQQYFHLHLQ